MGKLLKHFVELPCCGCEWEYQGSDLYKVGDTETFEVECWDCGAEVDVTLTLRIETVIAVVEY